MSSDISERQATIIIASLSNKQVMVHCAAVVMFSFDLTINGKMVNSHATNCRYQTTSMPYMFHSTASQKRTLIQVRTGRLAMRSILLIKHIV